MLSAKNCQQKLSRQIAFDCLQAYCVKKYSKKSFYVIDDDQ